jgi:hypothetical protein
MYYKRIINNNRILFYLRLESFFHYIKEAAMKNKIGLYFQLETEDPRDSYSAVKQTLSRLEQLEEEGLNVQYFELRLKKLKGLQKAKGVFMKLDGEGGTFIENEASSQWSQAFDDAFERIHHNLRSLNSSYSDSVQYV